MQIKIDVTETLSRVITVEADNIEDAIDKVKNKYSNEEIILDYSDIVGKATFELFDA